MTLSRLVFRSASYHWRTNLAVCLGVAAAVAVLAGALLVGDSVRGSLRDLALSRLGGTEYALSSTGFFREALAGDLARGAGARAVPLISTTGFVTHEPSGRRASGVLVYGVDERFWRFHGVEVREGVFVSPALASELGVSGGDVLLTRLQRPSDMPLESLYAQKEDIARTARLSVSGVLPRDQLGEFTLQPRQGEVRAVFAPLRRLQRDMGVAGQVNTLLLSGGGADVERAQRTAIALEDMGVKVEVAADRSALLLESRSGIIAGPLEAAARSAATTLGLPSVPVFTYLANTIRVGDRAVPYSLITGIDLAAIQPLLPGTPPQPASAAAEPIVLNEWTARELAAKVGDVAELEYYLWDTDSGLRTDRARFTVSAIVPIAGVAADRRLAPEYPGITGAESLSDWDPPFPIDLSRVRPQDEQYWHAYRTTPKAFVAYDRARQLWATRYGSLTGLRFPIAPAQDAAALAESFRTSLRDRLSPAALGIVLLPVRRQALEASTGATDFGEYFTYFSFFLVASAVLLAVLFFRLSVEGRLRQLGVLRASGYTSAHLRRMLLAEAAVLAVVGSAIGVVGALGYAHLIVYGLKTWWVGAVNTTLLRVHVTPWSLAAGAAGGIVAALLCVLVSVRSIARTSPRTLLGAYSLDAGAASVPDRSRAPYRLALVVAVAGFALLATGFFAPGAQAAAFFGAGTALLSGFLLALRAWLRSRDSRVISGRGPQAISRLGFRGAAFRPGRSVLSAALIASAVFIIVSVDAFRRDGGQITTDPHSGTGGFALLAESQVPLVENPGEPAGREALLIRAPELARVRFSRFRVRPGEDASCLNLYRPTAPTIIAPERAFVDSGRFTFASSLAQTDEERANPWLLLRRTFEDGAVPVIADATSLQYVLHASVGGTMSMDLGGGARVVLRFAGALRDSVLQGQLVMGEEPFTRLFPGHDGFRFFLLDAPDVSTPAAVASLAEVVERELAPFGVDAVSTVERLDGFHRVENTYLSTFQALGGLGVLLGTVGLATVMFRNVLERRRELALLRAVGYDARHITLMILAETAFLLLAGVGAGTACALIAIAPAWLERGRPPGIGLGLLLIAVMGVGLLSAVAATRAALGGRLLQALRAE